MSGRMEMQRSEMLLEIVEVLNNAPKSVVNSYIADCILTRLEDCGMLPPEVDPIPQHIIDNCESANYWEDEDEK